MNTSEPQSLVKNRKLIRGILPRTIFALAAMAGLVACANGATVTKTPTGVIATPSPAPSATPMPFMILFAPAAPKTEIERQAREALAAFAGEHGWRTETLPPGDAVPPEALGRNPELIAGVGSGMARVLMMAADQNPALRFILVEETAAAPRINLLVIGGDQIRKDEAGFIAGLLAGIVNGNHRAGWVGEGDTVSGKLYRNGFLHGLHYNCPLCLLYAYEVAPGATAADGEAQAALLLADYVSTASAMPGLAGDAALKVLAARHVDVAGVYPGLYSGLFLAGSVRGADDVLGEPAIQAGLVVKDVLARWFQGEKFDKPVAYSMENGGLVFGAFPNSIMTIGKQTLLKEILDDVKAGRLAVGVNPETGEPE